MELETDKWLGSIPSDDPDDPRPFLLPGVRVKFRPIGPKAVRAAREAVREALRLAPNDVVEAGDALSIELIRRGIIEWEGISLEGTTTPVAATADEVVMKDGAPLLDEDERPVIKPGTISSFVAMARAFEAADQAYVYPWVLKDREGNASAGSPNGTGAAATPANGTASSPAKPKRKAAAVRTRKPGRKAAPTS